MRSEDVVGVVAEVLEPALDGLLLAPRGDAGVRMPAQVVGPRRPLGCTQLPVHGPRFVVDADYAARGSLRRHVDSVADRALTRHHPVTKWLHIDLLLTGHPGVGWKGIRGINSAPPKPP